MAGYSGTPLVKKLGIAAGMRVRVLDAPADYRAIVPDLPTDLDLGTSARGRADLVHAFITRAAGLEDRLAAQRERIHPDGVLWVSWPKRAAKLDTDVTEDVIRRAALAVGLVDVKVCAVNDTWSGLKLVVPVKLR